MYLVVILFRKISKLLHSAHFLKKIGIASSTYAPKGCGVNLSLEIKTNSEATKSQHSSVSSN